MTYIDNFITSNLKIFLVANQANDCKEIRDKYITTLIEDKNQAIKKMYHDMPDFIVVNDHVANIDTLSFCKTIKENPLTCHVPIIVIGAIDQATTKIKFLEAGVDACVDIREGYSLLFAHIKNLHKQRCALIKRGKYEKEYSHLVEYNDCDEIFIQRAEEVVLRHYSNENFNVAMFVKEMKVSRTLLFLKMKTKTGESPSEYIRNIRLKEAAKLLKKGKYNVSEVAYLTGFSDPKYLSKKFKDLFGVTPRWYMKMR